MRYLLIVVLGTAFLALSGVSAHAHHVNSLPQDDPKPSQGLPTHTALCAVGKMSDAAVIIVLRTKGEISQYFCKPAKEKTPTTPAHTKLTNLSTIIIRKHGAGTCYQYVIDGELREICW